jgi:hypothetical protein
MDVRTMAFPRRPSPIITWPTIFFLPINASLQPCQIQHLFKKVRYTEYFGVDHQNMELAGDPTAFHLNEKVHVSLEAH